jgi:uncharacterized protein YndB with AHSA1/START domain
MMSKLAKEDHMADIQHSVQIAAKPEKVYPLIATAKGLGQWWATDITEPPGAVELGFFKRTSVYRLRLKVDKPAAQAEWACESGQEWAGTHIVFRLEARDPGTLLRFTHGGWQSESDYFISCNTAWGELMYRLKAAAEGKSRGPLFLVDGLSY